jgi:hypothetical protein
VPEICALDALCAFASVNGKQQHKNAIMQNCCKRFIEDLLESSFISLSMVLSRRQNFQSPKCQNRETARILNSFDQTSSEKHTVFNDMGNGMLLAPFVLESHRKGTTNFHVDFVVDVSGTANWTSKESPNGLCDRCPIAA